MLTVSLKKDYNKAVPLKYVPTQEEMDERNLTASEWPYTFYIPPGKLHEIGLLIQRSRSTVPSTFMSKWENPIVQSGGNRGVDWLDFFLYMVPTLFVPALANNDAKAPLLYLSKACAVALKWEIKETDIRRLQKYV